MKPSTLLQKSCRSEGVSPRSRPYTPVLQVSQLRAEVAALEARLRAKEAGTAEAEGNMQHREDTLKAARGDVDKEYAKVGGSLCNASLLFVGRIARILDAGCAMQVAAMQEALAAAQRDMQSRQADMINQQDTLDTLRRCLQ